MNSLNLKVRKVTTYYVDEINMVAREWDCRDTGTVAWRDHMAKLLNLKVKALASEYDDAPGFLLALNKYALSIGFGEPVGMIWVTQQIYGRKKLTTKDGLDLLYGEGGWSYINRKTG